MGFKTFIDLPEDEPVKVNKTSGSRISLKKGDTVFGLIKTAQQLVKEKLGKYKEISRCVIDINELQTFFDSTPDNAYMAIDTETTRLILGLSINKVNQFIIGCAKNSANGPELVIAYG